MHIAIHGIYGKMGQKVLEFAQNESNIKKIYGVDIQEKIDKNINIPIVATLQELPEKVDCIIDFSTPQAVFELLSYAKMHNIAVVLATTSYTATQLQAIQASASEIAIFQSANFSMGMALLQHLVERASSFLGAEYDIEIIEKHHNLKKDSPSGSAYMLADSIQKSRTNLAFTYGRKGGQEYRKSNEIGIHAVRGGTIVGEHEVLFCGLDEVITVKHTAQSKDIFAIGAIKAAQFLYGKKHGLYTMQDLIQGKK